MIRKLFLYQNYIKMMFRNKMRLCLTIIGLIIPAFLMTSFIIILDTVLYGEMIKFKNFKNENIIIAETQDLNFDLYSRFEKIEDVSVILELRNKKSTKVLTRSNTNHLDIRINEVCIRNSNNNFLPAGDNQINRYNAEIEYGEWFADEQLNNGENVVVIDTSLAKLLFGRKNAVGEIISFPIMKESIQDTTINIDYYKHFKIIGILKCSNESDEMRDSLIKAGMNEESIYIFNIFTPMAKPIEEDYNEYSMTNIIKSDIIHYKELNNMVENIVYKFRLYNESALTSYDTIIQRIQYKNEVYAKAIIVGMTVFFVISGFSIMNTIFFSIKERIREIGIRNTIGAYTEDIIEQFIIEGLFYGLFGGGLGCLLAILATSLLFISNYNILTSSVLVIKPESFIISILCSCFVGVIASIFPSFYIAKKNPINAMNSE